MRILHCIPSLGGGGAERQLSYLAPELVRLGHDVHIGYLQPGANYSLFQAKGISLHRLIQSKPSANTGQNWVNYDPRLLWRLMALIRAIRPDVVQTWAPQMNVLAGLASLLVRKPWGIREAASGALYPPGLKTFLNRRIVGRASFIVSNSAEGDRYWARAGRAAERLVIRNGINLDLIEAASAASVPGEHKTILFAGRFEDAKNIFVLVRALAIVLGNDPQAQAILCGDGPHRPQAERLVSRYKCSGRIRFAGFRPDLWSLMKSADVFVSVSHSEGCPNAVLEAMACGCPVLVSDIPEHRELLNPETAIFVDRNDAAAISKALLSVLADPESARIRALRARFTAELLSVPAMAAQYELLYRRFARIPPHFALETKGVEAA